MLKTKLRAVRAFLTRCAIGLSVFVLIAGLVALVFYYTVPLLITFAGISIVLASYGIGNIVVKEYKRTRK